MKSTQALFLLLTALAALCSLFQECIPFEEPHKEKYLPGFNVTVQRDTSILIYYGTDVGKTNIPLIVTNENLAQGKNGFGLCSDDLFNAGECKKLGEFIINFKGNETIQQRTFNKKLLENENVFYEIKEKGVVCLVASQSGDSITGLELKVSHSYGFLPIGLANQSIAIGASVTITMLLAAIFVYKTKIYKFKDLQIRSLPNTLIYLIIVYLSSLEMRKIALVSFNEGLISERFLILLQNIEKYLIGWLYYLSVYQYSINVATVEETFKGLRWKQFKRASIIYCLGGAFVSIQDVLFKGEKSASLNVILKFILNFPCLIAFWFFIYKNFKETSQSSTDVVFSKRIMQSSYVLICTRLVLIIISFLIGTGLTSIQLYSTAKDAVTSGDLDSLSDPYASITESYYLKDDILSILVTNLVEFTEPVSIVLLCLIWREDFVSSASYVHLRDMDVELESQPTNREKF